jgi:A118 family predicted phage portal protein
MTIESIIKEVTGKDVVALNDLTDLWLQYYKGNVDKFHNYQEYNGNNNIKRTRKTLNMPKKVCEDWANLLLNEKTDVVVGDDKQQNALWELLNKVHFWTKGNEGIEKTFALGTGAFVETADAEGNERLQFITRNKIYPITFDQDRITECAFVNVNSKTTIIQMHIKGILQEDKVLLDKNGNYFIITMTYEKKVNDTSEDIGELIDESVFDTGSDLPWFQIYKPNIANNLDINSPMGISIYANALDTLQGVDLAYDGFCEEMRLGRSRIFVNKHLIRRDENGETKVFDNNESGFYYGGETENAKPFEFYSPTLRTESYFNGINNALNLLSSKVGFGENHYRFDKGGVTTATQVISENSEMFRSLKKHEILLNDVIINVCKALMYIHNKFTDDGFKFDLNANIEVKFDDSIIEDKETMKMTDRQDVNMGVMSKAEYRMKWYNEDEETAKQKLAEIEEANRQTQANWFSGE